jgi:hypothetical protein
MMVVKVATEQAMVRGAFQQLQANRPICLQRATQHIRRGHGFRDGPHSIMAAQSQLRCGQPWQPSSFMQLAQKQVALAGLQSTIRPLPAEQFAHRGRQLGQGQVGILTRDLTYQRQLLRSQRTATEG